MRELEADLGIPKTTVSEILMQDLGMKHIMAKFVPWLLLVEQKDHRAVVDNDLIQTATQDRERFKAIQQSRTRNGYKITHKNRGKYKVMPWS